jgi:hypothetical protein
MNITVTHYLTEQDFIYVITTALEGGSNYWYMLDTDQFKANLPAKTEECTALSERIGKALYNDPEFKLPVEDKEEPGAILGYATQESCKKAFEKLNIDNPLRLISIIEGQYDAADADHFFQLAVMGKLLGE